MKGIDWLAIFVGAVMFALVGMLWYARPSDVMWLAGSVIWGVVAFTLLYWYTGKRT